MKTLIHTDKEQIESIIRQSDVCFVGMADTVERLMYCR